MRTHNIIRGPWKPHGKQSAPSLTRRRDIREFQRLLRHSHRNPFVRLRVVAAGRALLAGK